jgi:hypothetical protein
MDLIVLIIICLCLTVHRNLSSYQQLGLLPNEPSFLFYTLVFNIVTAISFIWLFGFGIGFILFLLTFFQITYTTFLWPFLIFGTMRRDKKLKEYGFNIFTISQDKFDVFRPAKIIHSSWAWLVIILTILTIVNLLLGEFGSLKQQLFNLTNGSYLFLLLYTAIIIAIGNALRMLMIKLLIK